MIPSKTPVRLYWQMVDQFLRRPGDWRFLSTDWGVESVLETSRHLLLRATIAAGLGYKNGRYTISARVQVKGGTSVAFSRAAARELEQRGFTQRLRQSGFRWRDELLAYYPLSAWKSVYARTFMSERRFLSELAQKNPGTTRKYSPRSLREMLAGFRGKLAGDWHPLNGQWELRKPIHIAGRPATAICMFHIATADLEGRLGVASSITSWPPWNGTGRLPVWLTKSRETLDSQFGEAGHRAEWHRGPRSRGVMITSMREDLAGFTDVLRERRMLEAAHIGDPD